MPSRWGKSHCNAEKHSTLLIWKCDLLWFLCNSESRCSVESVSKSKGTVSNSDSWTVVQWYSYDGKMCNLSAAYSPYRLLITYVPWGSFAFTNVTTTNPIRSIKYSGVIATEAPKPQKWHLWQLSNEFAPFQGSKVHRGKRHEVKQSYEL